MLQTSLDFFQKKKT